MSRLMNQEETISLLNEYSIGFDEYMICSSEDEAIRFSNKIGYPVVMKVVSEKIVHKSDSGCVFVNIHNEEEARASYEKIIENANKAIGEDPEGVLIQKMKWGHEVIVGIKQDPQFGPVILFGMGGIFVEVLKDVSMRIAPLTEEDCHNMIREIKAFKILSGIRGQKPADLKKIAKIIHNASKLAIEREDILEMDLNPIMVDDESAYVVDARIIVKKTGKKNKKK